jgi:hypothetical protein
MNEDFPEPTNKDVWHSIGKGAIASFPVVGGSTAEMLNLVFVSPLEKRRSKWLNELSARLKKLEDKGIYFKTLSEDPIFTDTILNATTIAIKTSNEEKLKVLQNAVINTGKRENPDEIKTQIFLNVIESMTPTHIKILTFFNNPPAWYALHQRNPPQILGGGLRTVLYDAYPEFSQQGELVDLIWSNLESLGFHRSSSLSTITMGYDNLESRTTILGKEFIKFISFTD